MRVDQFKELNKMRERLNKNKETFNENKPLLTDKKITFKQEIVQTPKIENKLRGGLWKNK